MNCSRCGNWNADTDVTCRQCGNPLAAPTPPAPPATVPVPTVTYQPLPPAPPRGPPFSPGFTIRLLMVAAVVFALGGLMLPWYGTASDTVNSGRHNRGASSWGVMSGFFGGSSPSAYTAGSTDALVNAVAMLMMLGFLSLLAGIYLVRKRRKGETIGRGVVKWAFMIALSLLLLAPVAFAIGLPGARKQDILDQTGSYTDPGHPTQENSFIGSWPESLGGGITRLESWGPDIGWVSALLAGVCLLLVMFLDAKSQGEERILK